MSWGIFVQHRGFIPSSLRGLLYPPMTEIGLCWRPDCWVVSRGRTSTVAGKNL